MKREKEAIVICIETMTQPHNNQSDKTKKKFERPLVLSILFSYNTNIVTIMVFFENQNEKI